MSVALKLMSVESFLEWEAEQTRKHEFDGVAIRAMTGGTAAHARIQRNLTTACVTRLRGSSCEFFGSDMKLFAGKASVRYPDGMIVCSRLPDDATAADAPLVVFEVLSPSTATIDRIIKNREYEMTLSIGRYVMLEQDRMAATVFVRKDGDWVGHLVTGETTLDMPEAAIAVPLAEIYEGVELAVDPMADEA